MNELNSPLKCAPKDIRCKQLRVNFAILVLCYSKHCTEEVQFTNLNSLGPTE